MTYPTIFERLRAMQPEESLSALIGEACDVGDELVEALSDARDALRTASLVLQSVEAFQTSTLCDDVIERALDALAKARRCPDGECTEKCANGGAA